jgi:hypothetical protein
MNILTGWKWVPYRSLPTNDDCSETLLSKSSDEMLNRTAADPL